MLRRKKIILAIVIVLLLAGPVVFGVWWLRVQYIMNNFTKLVSQEVHFTLDRSRVRPGETLMLTADFKKQYRAQLQTPLVILVAPDGTEYPSSYQDLIARVESSGVTLPKLDPERRQILATELPKLKGIVTGDTYGGLQNPSKFYIGELGCMIGFGPPTVPPKRLVSTDNFVILPATPPGEYHIRIDQYAYCNGLPTTVVLLPLTIIQ